MKELKKMKKYLKVNGEYQEVSNEKLEELVEYYHRKNDCQPVVLEEIKDGNLYFVVECYEC